MKRSAAWILSLLLGGVVASSFMLLRSTPDDPDKAGAATSEPFNRTTFIDESSESSLHTEPATARPSRSATVPRAELLPGTPGQEAAERDGQRALPSVLAELRVEDTSQSPIAGAVVTVSTIGGDLNAGYALGPEEAEEALRSSTLAGESGPGGAVDLFAADGLLPTPAVVWASKAGHRSSFQIVRTQEQPTLLVLGEAPSVHVRVLDETGLAVEGAEIVHRGCLRPDALPPDEEARICEIASLLFERRVLTDSKGTGAACAHPSLTVVRAYKGALASPEVAIEAQTEIDLRLGPTFELQGLVTWPAAYEPDARAQVLIFRVEEGRLHSVGRARVAADGSFGPSIVSLAESTQFAFQSSAPGLIPLEERRPAPPPGDRLTIDFRPEQGVELPVRVEESREDTEPIPLADANVGVAWQTETGWIWGKWGKTDETGRTLLSGLPPTTVWVRAEKEGYGTFTHDPVELPGPPGAALPLTLRRAGLLRGRCTANGEPVENFEVLFWQGDPSDRDVERIEGSVGGSFEIENAPLGGLYVMASSASLPEGEAVYVEVGADEPAEVELTLGQPVIGRGRIVDSISGDPIPGAWVVPTASYGMHNLLQRGGRIFVANDGRFAVESFAPRDGRLMAGAPGYQERMCKGFCAGTDEVEFGVIALHRPQSLEVVLETDGTIDPTSFVFQADGPTILPYLTFPPDATLVFEDVLPGKYDAWLFSDGIPHHNFELVLVPGVPWRAEVSVSSAPLEVEVVPADGQDLPRDCGVAVHWLDPRGRTRMHFTTVPPSKRVLFPHVAAGEALVGVSDHLGSSLAIEWVDLPTEEPRAVRIQVSTAPFHGRVMDTEGRALVGAHVFVFPAEGGSKLWRSIYNTDHRGRFDFYGVRFQELHLAAYHAAHGVAVARNVRLARDGSGDAEIVVGVGQPLVVRVLDGERPLSGVTGGLCPFEPTVSIVSAQSDDDGLLRFPRVGAGEYLLSLSGARLWTTVTPIRVTGSSREIEVQVQPVGDLVLAVLDRDGAPVAGVPVAVRPLEIGGTVEEWVRTGRAHAEPRSMRTDEGGELRLSGLPRGRYSCTTPGTDGEPVESELAVGAKSLTRHAVRRP